MINCLEPCRTPDNLQFLKQFASNLVKNWPSYISCNDTQTPDQGTETQTDAAKFFPVPEKLRSTAPLASRVWARKYKIT